MRSVIITSLGRLITVAKVGAGLTEDITWSDVTYIKWVQCEGALSITSACLPNILSLGRRMHQHGLRAALKGKPLDLSHSATLNHTQARHDFRKLGGTVGQGLDSKREGSMSTDTTIPKDPFGSEEELRVLTTPVETHSRSYYVERGYEMA